MERISLVRHSRTLWLLLFLFCFRVLAQFVIYFQDVPFLPAFDKWHSASIPYSVLVSFQLIIILILARVALQFHRRQVVVSYRIGVLLLITGGFYFIIMLARLMIGLSGFSESGWWDQPIPSVFHLVLALFVIVVGQFHWRHGRKQ